MAEGFVLEEISNKSEPQVKHEGVVPRGNSIAAMLSDRNGNPPTQEQLQAFQNKLMGRNENFAKLSREEKEKIMFKEMQDWHFSQMPKIEDMKKELEKNPLTFEVKSLNSNDTKGYQNQHVNILSENVKLTIVSDSKTINFNNKELLEQYRQAINKQKNPKKQVSDVQARGAETHSNRIFDD